MVMSRFTRQGYKGSRNGIAARLRPALIYKKNEMVASRNDNGYSKLSPVPVDLLTSQEVKTRCVIKDHVKYHKYGDPLKTVILSPLFEILIHRTLLGII